MPSLPWSGLFCLSSVLIFCPTTLVRSEEPVKEVPAANLRWAPEGSGGVPEFQRHVVPLLGKLGCNNRACHGSFQGQHGFRLSLFGHDPQLDYTELVKEERYNGPRVNLEQPEKSLALYKPTHGDRHKGGERMKTGSWQYRLLHDWIAGGAPFDPAKESKLMRLEVGPPEVRVEDRNKSVQLRTVAYFSDNTCEDVTALTLFSTNDESVADVTDAGLMTVKGSGDTAIVATFGGAVITSQVIVPVKEDGQPFPAFPPNNKIDEFVLAKLKKLGIKPSPLASDEVFLRRVYLDVIGTLPTAEEARRFLQDGSPDKRAKLIDQLLDRPEYAMYWATKFDDWTGNDNRFTPQPRAKTAWLWHDWLRDKLERNVPYDEIVGGFLTASTREGRSVEETVAEHQKVAANLDKGFGDGTYAARKTNDIFWKKAGNTRPETVALRISYAFLGVRLECAQCHKHPFDRWTQDDFRGFTSIFASMGRGTPKDVPKNVNKGAGRQTYKYTEAYHDRSKKAIRRLMRQPPRLLNRQPIAFKNGEDPREALWQWMRSPDNPYFSRAIANRLWGHYLGVGIVDPVDDFNAANPPSNPALLDWLARDFVEHRFDLKHLHRTILNSRTYQLSWIPNDSNRHDERNFSHALLRRMPAEVVLDAINQITGGSDRYSSSNAPKGVRTINLAITRLRGGGPEYVLGIFGRPLRTQTCDCERSSETGLAQAMYLLNDTDVNRKINDPKGQLARLLKQKKDDRQLIEELYLSTLSRFPTDEEMKKALDYVASAKSREAGMQDMMWSLLNLREFVFVH
jgi:hypothetical protein